MIRPSLFSQSEIVIDIWRLPLNDNPASVDWEAKLPSKEERQRQAAFINPRDAQRFARRRRLLRCILAQYTGDDPAELKFSYGSAGKPSLLQDRSAESLSFNSSDTGNFFVVAVSVTNSSTSAMVGVDIEGLREIHDPVSFARRFFSANEFRALAALPVNEHQSAVLTCWVRKEAAMKAHGDGIKLGVDKVNVGFAPIKEKGLSIFVGGRDFTIKQLDLGSGYVAAVAVEAPAFEIRYRTFDRTCLNRDP